MTDTVKLFWIQEEDGSQYLGDRTYDFFVKDSNAVSVDDATALDVVNYLRREAEYGNYHNMVDGYQRLYEILIEHSPDTAKQVLWAIATTPGNLHDCY